MRCQEDDVACLANIWKCSAKLRGEVELKLNITDSITEWLLKIAQNNSVLLLCCLLTL